MGAVKKERTFNSKISFIVQHIQIYNLFLTERLSDKETLILALFLALPDDLVSTYRFNKKAREKVRKVANISTNNLSNILSRLLSKGVLSRDTTTGMWVVPQQLELVNLKRQSYHIKLKLRQEIHEIVE